MLRILGHPKRLCDGITRRDLLHVGGAGILGLGLNGLLEAKSVQRGSPIAQSARNADLAASFGRAKHCILLFLYGSPSQLETFDMKPDAPLEIRGTMKPIPSSVPGLDVVEHLPRVAEIMDRTTVVRSMTHPYPIHGVAFATTGVQTIDVAMELSPTDPRHQPYFGSALEYLLRRRGSLGPNAVDNVFLPFPFSSQRTRPAAACRPLRELPRRGLSSEMDRVRRRGDKGRRQSRGRAFRSTARSRISAARRRAISACRIRRSCRG